LTCYLAIIAHPAKSEYTICFPDLPGIVSWTDDYDQIAADAQTILSLAVKCLPEATGEPIPPPRSTKQCYACPDYITEPYFPILVPLIVDLAADLKETHQSVPAEIVPFPAQLRTIPPARLP